MTRAVIHDVDGLRRFLGKEAPFQAPPSHRSTGLPALDRLLARGPEGGGLPRGALTLLTGAPGSGRASLAAHILARETAEGRPVAWVDVRATIYPPALAQAGLALERLLVVRAPPERALYAAEQILASGVFRAVAMSGLERDLAPKRARRLQVAAESADAVGLVLLDARRLSVRGISGPDPSPPEADGPSGIPAALELHLARRGHAVWVTVRRDRFGASGRRALVSLESNRGEQAPGRATATWSQRRAIRSEATRLRG